jgi:hypothetical protein
MAPPLGFGGSAYRIQWLSNAGIINGEKKDDGLLTIYDDFRSRNTVKTD